MEKQLPEVNILSLLKQKYIMEKHHIDPTKKDTIISSDSITLEKAIEESKKCILICSNCHKEFHAGLWNLNELNLKEMEEVEHDSNC